MKVRLTIEVELDKAVYGNLDEDVKQYMERNVLIPNGTLYLQSNKMRDEVGKVIKVENIEWSNTINTWVLDISEPPYPHTQAIIKTSIDAGLLSVTVDDKDYTFVKDVVTINEGGIILDRIKLLELHYPTIDKDGCIDYSAE